MRDESVVANEEFIILVDRRDRITGYKPRREMAKDDMYRFAMAWLEDGQGNVLIHRRSEAKKNYPGLWQNAAGGFVQRGENARQAAMRELREELGIHLPLKRHAKVFIRNDGPGRWAYFYHTQTSVPLKQLTVKPDEVAELRWINKNELFDWIDRETERFMPSAIYWRELFSD